MDTDLTQPNCPRCGAKIPPGTAAGSCARCALADTLESSPQDHDTQFLSLHDIPPPGAKIAYIGDYELLGVIARGGMGAVYRAKQKSLNRIVALKLLLGGMHAGEDFKRRFRHEAETAAKLKHPNIVPIYEVGEHEGQPYFSMEYVDGTNLAALTRDKPLPPRKAAEYVKLVAGAIAYAHQRGVLHRDLKPSNILLAADDRPRVTDFGLARHMNADSNLTTSGEMLGTPGYLPPEQVSITKDNIGPHSDIYSLGAVLYHLLTGHPPFQGKTIFETLQNMQQGELLPPTKLAPALPKDLEAICLKCLQKEPELRFATANDLVDELGRWLAGQSVLVRENYQPQGESNFSNQIGFGTSRKFLWAGAAMALVLLISLGVWFSKINEPAINPHSAKSQDATRTNTDAGFVSLFNGRDLSGWDGDPRFWSVEDGVIKGQSQDGNTPEVGKGNSYLIWRGGVVGDFELRFSYKLVKGEDGSGVLYRGKDMENWHAQGYRMDFWPPEKNSGALAYEASGNGDRPSYGVLAAPGEQVVWDTDGKKQITGGTEKINTDVQSAIRPGEWNDCIITARGRRIVHRINGNVTVEAIDSNMQRRPLSGILGLKMPPNNGLSTLVYFDDIRLKRFENRNILADTNSITSQTPTNARAMKLIADVDFGRDADGFFEHNATQVHSAFKDGHYQLTLATSGGTWWTGAEPKINTLKLNDFVCEIEAKIPSQAVGSWGLGLIPKNSPLHTWIGVMSDAFGKSEIFAYDEKPLLKWMDTAAIENVGGWNTFRVEATGEHVKLFVNDRFVGDAYQQERLVPTGLNLYVQAPVPGFEVWFRRVRVWQPISKD
jgi:serine/threonine protein kinase